MGNNNYNNSSIYNLNSENHSNMMRTTNSYANNNKDTFNNNLDYPAYDRVNKRQPYY